jgi:hypothetical protein
MIHANQHKKPITCLQHPIKLVSFDSISASVETSIRLLIDWYLLPSSIRYLGIVFPSAAESP